MFNFTNIQNTKKLTPIHLISALPFQKKFWFKKRVVLYRYDNDDTAIAINEWSRNKYLNYIIGVPLIIIVVVIGITILPFFLIIKKLNKETGEKLGAAFANFIEKLREDNHPDHQIKPFSNNQDYADTFKNKKPNKKYLRVLYWPEKNVEQLYGVSKKKLQKYIDEIWLYNDIQEVYNKAAARNSDIENSIIELEDNNEKAVPLNSKIEEIKIAKERNRKALYKALQLSKGKPKRILLAANNILPPSIILYVEKYYHPEINEYLTIHTEAINESLKPFNYKLLYLPLALDNISGQLGVLTNYHFPNFDNKFVDQLNEASFSKTSVSDITMALTEVLSMPSDMPSSCFIRCVRDGNFNATESSEYSVFPLAVEADETLSDKIDFYFSVIGRRIDYNDIYCQLGSIDEADPDDCFYSLGQHLNPEIKANIDAIKKLNDDKLLFSSMVYLISSLKESQPELCKQLNSTLYQAIQNQHKTISSVVIDEQHRIFLPDYNNIEIEMGPLPKTVFLFLLKHPEGVIFKELRQHVNELVAIYAKVGNRVDMDQIRDSINELTDPRSNSINEKCSRIKEAFVSKIDNSIAEHYYVTGGRSSNKGIKLDRSLVQFSQIK